MWILLALGSAFFAGLTAILAKIGIKDIDSTLATALRTCVVVLFSWLIVFMNGSYHTISSIEPSTWIFLCLSGMATGASWLCYFKALQIGNVNKVAPIDKSSVVLTMILAFIFLKEALSLYKVIGLIFIACGTYAMIERKDVEQNKEEGYGWLFFALGAAVFASLQSILGKIGVANVDSTLATAIRTIVVLIMSWIVVFRYNKQIGLKTINKKNSLYLIASGIVTGLSWLFYYRALQLGPASIVVPIDKLSIVVTVILSYIFLKERLNKRSFIGLSAIVIGTLTLLL